MEFWVTQAFNGISYGAMLFLLGSGLSLVFGVMRIVNLAHGSNFLLGGYVGLTTVLNTKSFLLALLSGALSCVHARRVGIPPYLRHVRRASCHRRVQRSPAPRSVLGFCLCCSSG